MSEPDEKGWTRDMRRELYRRYDGYIVTDRQLAMLEPFAADMVRQVLDEFAAGRAIPKRSAPPPGDAL